MAIAKSELDKFYTKVEVAQQCVDTLVEFTDIDLWLEPSAGAGAFLSLLPHPRIGIDIDPENKEIEAGDYLEYRVDNKYKHIAVVGNPPFGKNSSLAIKFFNHSAKFADVIAFIVPLTFRKTSVQNKLSLNFVLHKELELPKNSFTVHEDAGYTLADYHVPCVWQIWIRGKRNKVALKTNHPDWEWCEKEEADYAIRRVGGNAGKCYDSFDQYAKPSHYYIKCTPAVFERLDSLYEQFKAVAKNTAGNPSLGKGELIQIYERNFYDKN